MKNYLLTGGFAAMLLLSACGSEETEQAEAETEEATEEETEESTEEQTTEESTEEAETVEEPAENSDQAAATEEANTESGNVETLKEAIPEKTIQLENVNLTIEAAQINKLTADENLAMFVEGVEAGQEVNNLVIQYTVENTTEAPRSLFIDQAEIVTSTGQQIAPELLLTDGITAMMQGAVSSTGTVPYLLEPGTGQEIEWVDVIVPAIMDEETYNVVSEEQKIRIEF